jgi:transposase InsO family protein
MCRVLEVSKAGYYAWRGRAASLRAQRDAELMLHIAEIYKRSRATYGSPRIHAELKASGVSCGRKRIARLMKNANICGKIRGKRYRYATQRKNDDYFAPNLLNRCFYAERTNRMWVADITYIPIRGRWIYLATILDLYSRRVVGWAVEALLDSNIAVNALQMALRNRRPPRGLIHHSDRGTQYASDQYRQILAKHGIICSMSRTRDCWDNAVAESFFATLKSELLPHSQWPDKSAAERAISDYIEVFYNRQRRHSFNKYLSPASAEAGAVA